MPTSADDGPGVLVDTSVAVALALADHEHHAATRDRLAGHTLGLAGHAYFETYSVLTRLPPPARRAPRAVDALLRHNFPESRFLDAGSQRELVQSLATSQIAGGAVYDALVGAAARHHGLALVTRDSRAADVYQRLDVEFELLG